MTDENMRVWRALETTDPKFTKKYNRGYGDLTDINPQYRYMKMTETFGPVGQGWGVDDVIVDFKDLETKESMVLFQVRVWYKPEGSDEICRTPPGFGQGYLVEDGRSGPRSDQDGAKKGFTDALGNALKYIGLGADVYLGMYDNPTYVQNVKDALRAPVSAAEAPSPPSGDGEAGKPDFPPLEPPEEPSGWSMVAQAFIAWMDDEKTIPDLAEYWSLNTDTMKMLSQASDEHFGEVRKAVRLWVRKQLVRQEVSDKEELKKAWRGVQKVVNSLKNTNPVLYEEIRNGFNDISKAIEESKQGEKT